MNGNGTSTPKRAIAKAITYRAVTLLITFSVAFLITHDLSTATVLGLSVEAIHTVWYYFHERLWNRSDYGRI